MSIACITSTWENFFTENMVHNIWLLLVKIGDFSLKY